MHKKLLILAISRERGRGQRQQRKHYRDFKSHAINKQAIQSAKLHILSKSLSNIF